MPNPLIIYAATPITDVTGLPKLTYTIKDDFQTADRTVVTAADSDVVRAWQNVNSAPYIVTGNSARPNEVKATNQFAVVEADEGDGEIEIQFTVMPLDEKTSGTAFMGRFVDANNWVGIVLSQANGYIIRKLVNGVGTTIAQPSPVVIPTANDKIVFRMVGSTLRLFRNGTQIATATDPAFATATRRGMGMIRNVDVAGIKVAFFTSRGSIDLQG